MKKLLNIDANAKTVKGQKKGYMTAVLYLAPAGLSGYQVCPMASEGCKAACLNTAGRGKFEQAQNARIRKTRAFFEDRATFMLQLEKELSAFIRKAGRKGLTPTVRLNGTSDIVWEKVGFVSKNGESYRNLMERFALIQFYDYTKRPVRKDLPDNYHLTFSLAEDNDMHAQRAIEGLMNVAVVFRTKHFPDTYMHLPVLDGDETDLRFLDTPNHIVGLKAKGDAKKDTSGFVREVV